MGLFGKKEKTIEEVIKKQETMIRGVLYDYMDQNSDELSKYATLTLAKIDGGIRLIETDARTILEILPIYLERMEKNGIDKDVQSIYDDLLAIQKKLQRFIQ